LQRILTANTHDIFQAIVPEAEIAAENGIRLANR